MQTGTSNCNSPIAELIYGKTGIQCIIHAVHIDISCIILDSQIVISVDCFLEYESARSLIIWNEAFTEVFMYYRYRAWNPLGSLQAKIAAAC